MRESARGLMIIGLPRHVEVGRERNVICDETIKRAGKGRFACSLGASEIERNGLATRIRRCHFNRSVVHAAEDQRDRAQHVAAAASRREIGHACAPVGNNGGRRLDCRAVVVHRVQPPWDTLSMVCGGYSAVTAQPWVLWFN